MHEIIQAFGIDWRLIGIQIFNFGILMLVLWYFLYTPVLTLLADREEKIRTGLQDAENAQKELATAEHKKMEILQQAHTDAASIVQSATVYAEDKKKSIVSSGIEDAENELRNAKKSAEQMKERILKESEAEVAQLAMLAAEKMLNTALSK